MWNNYWSGRPRRNVPQVNYNQSSDEDDFDSPLQSPQRPPPTRAGSPVDLAVPTLGDNVDEELEAVSQTLSNVGHSHTYRNTRPLVRPDPEGGEQPGLQEVLEQEDQGEEPLEEIVDEGFINQPPPADLGADAPVIPNMVNFDEETGEDTANALESACRALKGYEWEPTDLD